MLYICKMIAMLFNSPPPPPPMCTLITLLTFQQHRGVFFEAHKVLLTNTVVVG